MTKVLQDVPGFIQMRSRSGGRVHQQVQRCLARNNAQRATLFQKCRELAAEMPEIYFRYGHIWSFFWIHWRFVNGHSWCYPTYLSDLINMKPSWCCPIVSWLVYVVGAKWCKSILVIFYLAVYHWRKKAPIRCTAWYKARNPIYLYFTTINPTYTVQLWASHLKVRILLKQPKHQFSGHVAGICVSNEWFAMDTWWCMKLCTIVLEMATLEFDTSFSGLRNRSPRSKSQ